MANVEERPATVHEPAREIPVVAEVDVLVTFIESSKRGIVK